MAKQLDKLTKEFGTLKKDARDHVEAKGPLETNQRHLEGMNFEASEAITRRVGELRKEGHTGKVLKDFADDKEMKVILSEVEGYKKELTDVAKKFVKLEAEAKTTHGEITKLKGKVDDEISDRQKKKDRKFFAVDSASLPELEKLTKQMAECAQELNDEIIQYLKTVPQVYDPAKTDKLMEKGVSASPEARDTRDQLDLAKRGLDARLLGKNTGLAKNGRGQVKSLLAQAISEFKEGDREKAAGSVKGAKGALDGIAKLDGQYGLAMKSFRPNDIKLMQESKEGQAIIKATEFISQMHTEANSEYELVSGKLKL